MPNRNEPPLTVGEILNFFSNVVCVIVILVVAIFYPPTFPSLARPTEGVKNQTTPTPAPLSTPTALSPFEALAKDACEGNRVYDPSYFELGEPTPRALARLMNGKGDAYERALVAAYMRAKADTYIRTHDVDRLGDQLVAVVGDTIELVPATAANGTAVRRTIAGVSTSRVRFDDGSLFDLKTFWEPGANDVAISEDVVYLSILTLNQLTGKFEHAIKDTADLRRISVRDTTFVRENTRLYAFRGLHSWDFCNRKMYALVFHERAATSFFAA